MFEAFLLIGLTIIVGYAALLIADRYKISQVIVLMLFGFILGPGLHLVDTSEGSMMRAVYPFMATLALIILLFDGGLSFNIFNIFKTITKSTLFTFTVFALSAFFALVLIFYAGLEPLQALIVGAVLGGTSSAIVIALVEKTGASEETKSLLTIESMLTDSLVIIIVFVLIQIAKAADFTLGMIANSLLSAFAISIIFGAAGAFIWNSLLQKITKYELDYMLTVAALFILYALTEAVNANGGLAIFVFGLVLGNLKTFTSPFFPFYAHGRDERIRDFQIEVTFFTRTFFFAYIGMLFPLEKLTFGVIAASVLLTSLFIIARYIGARLILRDGKYEPEIIIPMLPRGLAAAVVVGLLMSNKIFIPHLEETVFTVIFLTNVIATVAVYAYGNGKKKEPPPKGQGKGHEGEKPEDASVSEKPKIAKAG